MVDCKLCGKPCLDDHDLAYNDTHAVCDALFTGRRDAGKCVDCGLEEAEVEFPCKHCMRFGSRVEARQAGGYTGP